MSELIVDSLAELTRRTAHGGREPLDPGAHVAVRHAIGLAVVFDYLHQLRGFVRWLEVALEHGRRAKRPPAPIGLRAEARFASPESLVQGAALGADPDAARRICVLAQNPGVRSSEFRTAAADFLSLWRRQPRQLIRCAKPSKEIDFFKRALAFHLAMFLPDSALGPTPLALLLAAMGTDDPIRRDSPLDSVAAAIGRRARRYRQLWSWARRRCTAVHKRYLRLPTAPATPTRDRHRHLRDGRLRPPHLMLSDGGVVVTRPRDIPVDATIVAKRGPTPHDYDGPHEDAEGCWLYAEWQEGQRTVSRLLGRAGGFSVKSRRSSDPRAVFRTYRS